MSPHLCCNRCSRYGLFKSGDSCLDNFCVQILNCIIAPFLLVYHSFRIYCFPFCTSTLNQCCCRLLFSPSCCLKCCSCFKHKDKSFLANEQSLGKVETDASSIIWKRAQDIIYEEETKKDKESNEDDDDNHHHDKCINHLFNKQLRAEDVSQGALGDCWLLSAVASLTSQQSLIQNAFMTKSFNPRGKYTMKLWDPSLKKYVMISVDDFIPVDKTSGQPCFVHPRGECEYIYVVSVLLSIIDWSIHLSVIYICFSSTGIASSTCDL
jgi:hypothetical protein